MKERVAMAIIGGLGGLVLWRLGIPPPTVMSICFLLGAWWGATSASGHRR